MKYLILLLTLTMGFGQTKLETRLYEFSYNDLPYDDEGFAKYINIQELVNFEGRYIIHPYAIMNYDNNGNILHFIYL